MKGFLTSVVVVCLSGGAACAGWWQEHKDQWADPCWQARYTGVVRAEINDAFAAQVNNGHVLDQTVWNWAFEPGTDRLTVGGQYYLAILARRRPHPDCKIFLQTAQDVAYDPAAPDLLPAKRADLDVHRVQAILRFLQAETAARPLAWDVTVHDPSEVGLSAVAVQGMMMQSVGSHIGVLPTTAGGGGAAPTGGSAASSGSGARSGY
jgi:hypothetical protein